MEVPEAGERECYLLLSICALEGELIEEESDHLTKFVQPMVVEESAWLDIW